MLNAFLKAIRQLDDPSMRRVLWLGLGLSLVTFLLLWGAIGYLLANTAVLQTGWLNTVIEVLGGAATLILTWLLFPSVAGTMTGFFLESVAEAVERRHYPRLPLPRQQPVGEVIWSSLRFFGTLLLLNVLALPLLLLPVVFPFVFLAVNGYLLGREYFELVAARRLDPSQVRSLRKKHSGTVFMAGVLSSLLLTIPGVNLLAPLIGTAAMVHLFEGFRARTAA